MYFIAKRSVIHIFASDIRTFLFFFGCCHPPLPQLIDNH
jgi:hypothetical protein